MKLCKIIRKTYTACCGTKYETEIYKVYFGVFRLLLYKYTLKYTIYTIPGYETGLRAATTTRTTYGSKWNFTQNYPKT